MVSAREEATLGQTPEFCGLSIRRHGSRRFRTAGSAVPTPSQPVADAEGVPSAPCVFLRKAVCEGCEGVQMTEEPRARPSAWAMLLLAASIIFLVVGIWLLASG